ncbi:MAG TPA: branched-chain amino acid ABC transporter permease, partial [Thermoanaerobaculia bacterium]|nr:branched-chain amino acid ABC transporter permease [Thermoanaerobaculia bacterium]
LGTLVLIYVMLGWGLNVVVGLAGLLDLGYVAFYAVGAYSFALLAQHFDLSFWQCLPLAGAFAAFFGVILGFPVLRLRGDYLAIVTLGFGEIIRVAILNIDAVGGARGFAGIPQRTDLAWAAAVAVLTYVFLRNLVRSYHGRALLAIREDEIAAEALGVPTTRYKVSAFVVAAFFAGVAGGLFSHYTYLHTNTFTFMKSIEVIVMVVLGGMGSLVGSVLGAGILTALPEVLRFASADRLIIYSLLLVVLMIARPQGILGSREIDWGRLIGRGRRPRPEKAS